MSIYEKTKCARALLYWAKNNNGNECYYLEDRMYAVAVADGDMVIILTADSYDEAKRKAKARPQGDWISQDYDDLKISDYKCNQCGHYQDDKTNFCPNCGADMREVINV